ncbi:FAD binding domain-containing protein [Isosphaeraceae bacterium EP7]
MKAFDFASPSSLSEALGALADSDDSAALAGGTDLINRMKDYVTSPKRVVYLKDVKGLAGITGDPKASGTTVGSGTLLASIVEHKGIKEAYPALWQAAYEVGTPQLRNMATVGGNLLQRPRCWYYRSGFGLLGTKDGKSLVRAGDNRYHSIFMTEGDALFASPSSLAVPLVALGATATLAGPKGERTVPVAELYRIPKTAEEGELAIQPGEILTKVMIPPAKGKNASYEIREKNAYDWPLVMASVNLTLDGETVSKASVILYGVAPIPYKSEAAEKAITGKKVDEETAAAAGAASVEGAKPLSTNGYKVALTKTAVKRALLAAVGNRYWEA